MPQQFCPILSHAVYCVEIARCITKHFFTTQEPRFSDFLAPNSCLGRSGGVTVIRLRMLNFAILQHFHHCTGLVNSVQNLEVVDDSKPLTVTVADRVTISPAIVTSHRVELT